MDRALQCDSLLRSIADHVSGVDEVAVIVRASSELHARSYIQLTAEHPRVRFWRQDAGQSASMLLAVAIDGADFVSLAVDDQVYFAPSDFSLATAALEDERGFVWSWRLGHEPGVTEFRGSYWCCVPEIVHRDYGYIFHTDGALYRRARFVAVLDRCLPDWRQGLYIPNDLECACAARRGMWAGAVGPHLGPFEQTCITFQINKEYTTAETYGAPWCSTERTRLDVLAEAYVAGARVSNVALYAAIGSYFLPMARAAGMSTHVPAIPEVAVRYAALVQDAG
jgi:hypothetical protein